MCTSARVGKGVNVYVSVLRPCVNVCVVVSTCVNVYACNMVVHEGARGCVRVSVCGLCEWVSGERGSECEYMCVCDVSVGECVCVREHVRAPGACPWGRRMGPGSCPTSAAPVPAAPVASFPADAASFPAEDKPEIILSSHAPARTQAPGPPVSLPVH